LVALLLTTGIKKGECLALGPNHIDLEAEKGPFLFVRYTSPQHRYKERKIALPESWVTAYQEYALNTKFRAPVPGRPAGGYLLEDWGRGRPDETPILRYVPLDSASSTGKAGWNDKIRETGVSKYNGGS
jgi:integrase